MVVEQGLSAAGGCCPFACGEFIFALVSDTHIVAFLRPLSLTSRLLLSQKETNLRLFTSRGGTSFPHLAGEQWTVKRCAMRRVLSAKKLWGP